MAITQIRGNQISTSTQAIITTLSFLNANSVLRIPAGSTANRPTGVSVGTLRFNTDNDAAEVYKADDGTGSAGWAAISGGGPAVGTDSIIRTNAATIDENITIGPSANGDAKFTNGMTAGPVAISNNYTVTIENNAAWSIR